MNSFYKYGIAYDINAMTILITDANESYIVSTFDEISVKRIRWIVEFQITREPKRAQVLTGFITIIKKILFQVLMTLQKRNLRGVSLINSM
jgi:hypothetical protein